MGDPGHLARYRAGSILPRAQSKRETKFFLFTRLVPYFCQGNALVKWSHTDSIKNTMFEVVYISGEIIVSDIWPEWHLHCGTCGLLICSASVLPVDFKKSICHHKI